MMIQERLKRSNLIMLVVPVAVAGVLLAVGLGVLVLLLETIYLPRLGLTMQDLHTLGEQAEAAFADLRHFVVLYGVVVIAVLLAALMRGIHHIQNGDLNAPIVYTKNDEFRPACDAVDEMAARLREKIEDTPSDPKLLQTVWGVGYRLHTVQKPFKCTGASVKKVSLHWVQFKNFFRESS